MESNPKDIEELSAVRDFMAGVPNDIEKLRGEIKVGMQYYGILEGFWFTFPHEDDYDKQGRLFGSPLTTVNKIATQGNKLDKDKDRFVAQMQGEQADFDAKVAEVSGQVSSFAAHASAEDFEEIAKKAVEIQKKLDEHVAGAKQYNMRENLTGQEETNYE